MELRNRSILITGGTSGIGKALVDQLSKMNTEIIVIGRNLVKLKYLEQKYTNVTTYQCSLSDRGDVEKTIGEITNRYPALSVVINNAGVQYAPTFLDNDFEFDSIENEITTNLTAPIWICALTLGHLLGAEQPTAVINITSGLALFPKKGSAVYCATKAGLRNFTKSFRYQLEDTSVRVFEAIMPMVDTPMTEGRGKGKISAINAASAIIKGIEQDTAEIFVGKTKLMPVMARVSPSLMELIMKVG